jgi:hypothetical protein
MDWEELDAQWDAIGRRPDPKMGEITFDLVQKIQNSDGKRICFSSYSWQCPKRVNDKGWYIGTMNWPFSHGIASLAPACEIKTDTFKGEPAIWVPIRTDDEFEKLEEWVKEQGDRIFLRDSLAISVALSVNKVSKESYTTVGALECKAKNDEDQTAIEKLTELCADAIFELAHYKDTLHIAAVPPSAGKSFHLPTEICTRLATGWGLNNISSEFSRVQKKPLRDLVLGSKWEEWESTGLRMNRELTNQDVILIDDLYQSGTTLQFVAMKLQEAGARNVFGLCLVKSWRDTDNQ